jgi:hypothetical protein
MKPLSLVLTSQALTHAHMIMVTPVPFGASTINNSPLLANGSDFPCKSLTGVYELEEASNVYSLGSTYDLTFKGQTVHGGGSCQVSITYDQKPTKGSVWKVITSIQGGCPAQNQQSNMGSDAGATNPFIYKFTIPSDIPAGEGSIAWTWFNKIGNREMYMNCGPLTLVGNGGSPANFDKLPDMFQANIGTTDCHVPENKDVLFPDPGEYVMNMNGATDAFQAPTGQACGTVKSSAGVSTAVSLSPTTATTTSAAPTSEVITIGIVGMKDKGEVLTSNGPCQPEGLWRCVDRASFQRCASGVWSQKQDLADGVECQEGEASAIKLLPLH